MLPLYNEVKPGQIFPPSKTITNFTVALVNDLISKLNANFGFVSIAEAIAAHVPAIVEDIYITGYYEFGDGGESFYHRVDAEPTHPGKFQSADGAWWELRAAGDINIVQFGGKGDNVTANDDPLDNAVLFIQSRVNGDNRYGGCIVFPVGLFAFYEEHTWVSGDHDPVVQGEAVFLPIRFRGQGGYISGGATQLIFKPTSAKFGIKIVGGQQFTFEDMAIVCGNANVTRLIQTTSVENVGQTNYTTQMLRFTRVNIQAEATPSETMLCLSNAVLTLFDNCWIRSGLNGSLWIGSPDPDPGDYSGGNSAVHVHFYGCRIYSDIQIVRGFSWLKLEFCAFDRQNIGDPLNPPIKVFAGADFDRADHAEIIGCSQGNAVDTHIVDFWDLPDAGAGDNKLIFINNRMIGYRKTVVANGGLLIAEGNDFTPPTNVAGVVAITIASGVDQVRIGPNNFADIVAAGFVTVDDNRAFPTLASATTTDLAAFVRATNQYAVSITGTTTIDSFGEGEPGMVVTGRFANTGGILTHGATTILVPGSANYSWTVNDRFTAVAFGGGLWLVSINKADGTAVVP